MQGAARLAHGPAVHDTAPHAFAVGGVSQIQPYMPNVDTSAAAAGAAGTDCSTHAILASIAHQQQMMQLQMNQFIIMQEQHNGRTMDAIASLSDRVAVLVEAMETSSAVRTAPRDAEWATARGTAATAATAGASRTAAHDDTTAHRAAGPAPGALRVLNYSADTLEPSPAPSREIPKDEAADVDEPHPAEHDDHDITVDAPASTTAANDTLGSAAASSVQAADAEEADRRRHVLHQLQHHHVESTSAGVDAQPSRCRPLTPLDAVASARRAAGTPVDDVDGLGAMGSTPATRDTGATCGLGTRSSVGSYKYRAATTASAEALADTPGADRVSVARSLASASSATPLGARIHAHHAHSDVNTSTAGASTTTASTTRDDASAAGRLALRPAGTIDSHWCSVPQRTAATASQATPSTASVAGRRSVVDVVGDVGAYGVVDRSESGSPNQSHMSGSSAAASASASVSATGYSAAATHSTPLHLHSATNTPRAPVSESGSGVGASPSSVVFTKTTAAAAAPLHIPAWRGARAVAAGTADTSLPELSGYDLHADSDFSPDTREFLDKMKLLDRP